MFTIGVVMQCTAIVKLTILQSAAVIKAVQVRLNEPFDLSNEACEQTSLCVS